jgi:hypothetical protein
MFLQLPSGLVGNIFSSFLCLKDVVRVGGSVCSHDYQAAYLEALRFTAVNLKLDDKELQALHWTLDRGVKINHLKLHRLSSTVLELLEAHPQLLSTIDLDRNERIDFAQIEVARIDLPLASKLRRLCAGESTVRVRIEACNLDYLSCVLYSDFASKDLAYTLLQSNPHLTSVSIIATYKVRDVLSGVQSLGRLLELRLRMYEKVGESVLVQIARCCPRLQTLGLTLRFDYVSTTFEGDGLTALALGCTDFRKLALVGNFNIADHVMQEFFRVAHRLERFDVQHTSIAINDAALIALAESNGGVPHLTALLAGLQINDIATVHRCATVLSHIRTFTATALISVLPITRQVVSSLHNVERLEVNSPLLTALRGGCYPKLKWLTVRGAGGPVVLHCLVEVVQHSPDLQYLWTHFSALSPELLAAVAQHCPKLQTFRPCSQFSPITTTDLVSVIQGCPLLTAFGIQAGTVVSDAVLQALAQHSYYLEELNLYRDATVTEAGLAQLVKSCKFLRKLAHSKTVIISAEFKCHLIAVAGARGRKLAVTLSYN